jgi:phosphoglucomutase
MTSPISPLAGKPAPQSSLIDVAKLVLSSREVTATELAGEKIESIIDHAPGDDAPIGGIRVSTASGWFAARPSGTEDIYKIYAESIHGQEQLQRILKEAQAIVDSVIARA